jgi:hypothetical protein
VTGFLRYHVGDVGVPVIQRETVTVPAGQAVRDVGPALAAIVAAIDAAVVLLVQPVGPLRVQPELVHALAGLGVRLRQEVRAHAGVQSPPGSAAIIGAVDTAAGRAVDAAEFGVVLIEPRLGRRRRPDAAVGAG